MTTANASQPSESGELGRLRAENRQLRESQQRLMQIMDALPVLAGYVDLDLRIGYSNRLLESWYQRPLDELLGAQLHTLFSQEHYCAVDELLQQVLSGREVDEEREITYPDGVTRRVHLNYIPHVEDDVVLGYFFLVQDVTQRHDAQQALTRANLELDRRVQQATATLEARNRELQAEIEARARSEERYRAVSELTSDLVYSYQVMDDGRMRADWHAGRLSAEFKPQETPDGHARLWWPIVHPDDRELLRKRIEKMLANHPAVDEFRVVDTEGRLRWIRTHGKPHWDEQTGRVVRMTGAARDITREKEAEQKFETTREQLAEALESMSDGFLLFDSAHRLITCNDKVRDLFPSTAPILKPGVSFEELLRVSVEAGEVKDAVGRAEEWISKRMAMYPHGAKASEIELRDGRWVMARDRPTRRGGVVGLRTDITDRKRAEMNLRRQEADLAHVLRRASMGEMASALAHELSQPLAAAVNYARGSLRHLQREQPDLAAVATALQEMCTAADRAKAIVKHVGDFVRRSKPEVQPQSVNELVRSVCELTSSSRQEERAAITLDLPADDTEAVINRVETEQVLFNLIRNGLDAMRSVPTGQRQLRIRVQAEGNASVLVSVADGGEGVATGLADNIFEPYVTSKETGLGMGLSISRTIIEGQGGRLWFTPNEPCGTVFYFTLPRA